MPSSILQSDTPDGIARADEPVVDLDRWRTAVEVAQKLNEAGIKCRVTLVPAKRATDIPPSTQHSAYVRFGPKADIA